MRCPFCEADNDRVIDSRASVVMDQCQKEAYGPFELPGAVKPDS